MIKYSNDELRTFKQIKKVQTSVVCDVCGLEIISCTAPKNWDWSTQKYFNVTTGHNDWRNDSWESIAHYDICPNCITGFVGDYVKTNKNSKTAYINIETKMAYPEIKYERVKE